MGAWKTFDADEKSYGSVQTLIPLQTQNAVEPYKDLNSELIMVLLVHVKWAFG